MIRQVSCASESIHARKSSKASVYVYSAQNRNIPINIEGGGKEETDQPKLWESNRKQLYGVTKRIKSPKYKVYIKTLYFKVPLMDKSFTEQVSTQPNKEGKKHCFCFCFCFSLEVAINGNGTGSLFFLQQNFPPITW